MTPETERRFAKELANLHQRYRERFEAVRMFLEKDITVNRQRIIGMIKLLGSKGYRSGSLGYWNISCRLREIGLGEACHLYDAERALLVQMFKEVENDSV